MMTALDPRAGNEFDTLARRVWRTPENEARLYQKWTYPGAVDTPSLCCPVDHGFSGSHYEGFELVVGGIGDPNFHVDGVSVPISRYSLRAHSSASPILSKMVTTAFPYFSVVLHAFSVGTGSIQPVGD